MLSKGRRHIFISAVLSNVGGYVAIPEELVSKYSLIPARLLMHVGGEYEPVSCSTTIGKSGGKIYGLTGSIRSTLCPSVISIVYFDPLVKTMGGAKASEIYWCPLSRNWSDNRSDAP